MLGRADEAPELTLARTPAADNATALALSYPPAPAVMLKGWPERRTCCAAPPLRNALGVPFKNSPDRGLAVAGLFQSLPSAEFRHAGGGNVDFGAGARIAAGRGLAVRDLEIAKADDPHRISAAKRSLDMPERRINGLLRRILRQIRILRHMGDQFSFVHGSSSFRSGPNEEGNNPRALGTLRFTNK